MAELRQVLQLAGTAIVDFDLPPNDDGPKVVMVLQTPATPAVIQALELQHLFSDGGDLLKQLSDRVAVSVELFNLMLSLPSSGGGFDNYYPEKVYKFKILRVPGDDDDDLLEFRVHIRTPRDDASKIRDLVDFHLKFLKGTFECALQPRQGELFEGGTRVNVAPEKKADEPVLASAGEMERRYGAGKRGKGSRVN